jgi:hypothetical protein
MKSRSTFSDFVYAITVGSAIGGIDSFSLGYSLAGAVLLIMIVFEDFYAYKIYIDPLDTTAKKYSLISLYIELAILLLWFGAFFQWVHQKSPKAVAWLVGFWAAKALARASYFESWRQVIACSVYLLPLIFFGLNRCAHWIDFLNPRPTLWAISATWVSVCLLYRILAKFWVGENPAPSASKLWIDERAGRVIRGLGL